jgi:hypothetical protein
MSDLPTAKRDCISSAVIEVSVSDKMFHKYWQLRVNAATSELEAVREIVGHRPTRGAIAENAVRNIVSPLLPHNHDITSGFLLTEDGKVSQQIDVLVFDRMEACPIYRDHAFAVMHPKMCVLAIEVKSVLNKREIELAVKNLASAKRLNNKATTVIFAFAGLKAEGLAKHLRKFAGRRSENRVDAIINLEQDYVILLDEGTRSVYNCYNVAGIAVETLLLQVVTSAKVKYIRDYLEDGLVVKEPFLQINV